jgi:hypothetical protein
VRLAAVIALALAAGCLAPQQSDDQPAQCEIDTDCPYAGQSCEEGICWGSPPEGDFAAVIGPPARLRGGVITTEVPRVALSADGTTDDLIVQAPVTLAGHVRMACPAELPACTAPLPVPATITVTRGSRFAGGSDYRTGAEAMRVADGGAFEIDVPPSASGDAPYVVTVVPSSADPKPEDDLAIDPAALVPPLRVEVHPDDDVGGLEIVLGGDGPRVLVGKVLDGAGRAVAGARVTAYGRWDAALPLERVGALATTRSDGAFRLLIAGSAKPIVDVVVSPPVDTVAPALRLRDLDASSNYRDLGQLRLPSYPGAVELRIPVAGYDPSGEAVSVAGAAITLSTTLDDGVGDDDSVATFETTTTTDADGYGTVSLIPGTQTAARTYTLRINPPAGSSFASVYERTLVVGASPGTAETVRLPKRVPISGVVRDATGAPVAGVTVVAKPALRFAWTLDDQDQALLEGVQPPAQVTAPNGSFIVFVDPDVAGEPASYDLECDPASGSLLPRWTATDVKTGAAQEIRLPEAAYVRGVVRDSDGEPVADAEVRLFAAATEIDQCAAAPYQTGGACEVPASLLALGRSDSAGWVRLVMPRP